MSGWTTGPQRSFPAYREALNRVWYRANPEPNVVRRRQVLRQPGYPERSGPVPASRRASPTGGKHSACKHPRVQHCFCTQAWLSPPPCLSGSGPPAITAGRRPTITRGLAFSAINLKFFPVYIRSNFSAKRDQVFQSFDF